MTNQRPVFRQLTNDSSGIGGGFVMTVFSAENQAAETLVARERAPGWAKEDMYNGNGSLSLKVRVKIKLFNQSFFPGPFIYRRSGRSCGLLGGQETLRLP